MNKQKEKTPFVFAEIVDTLGGNEPVIVESWGALTKLNLASFGSIAKKQNEVCVSL